MACDFDLEFRKCVCGIPVCNESRERVGKSDECELLDKCSWSEERSAQPIEYALYNQHDDETATMPDNGEIIIELCVCVRTIAMEDREQETGEIGIKWREESISICNIYVWIMIGFVKSLWRERTKICVQVAVKRNVKWSHVCVPPFAIRIRFHEQPKQQHTNKMALLFLQRAIIFRSFDMCNCQRRCCVCGGRVRSSTCAVPMVILDLHFKAWTVRNSIWFRQKGKGKTINFQMHSQLSLLVSQPSSASSSLA